MAEDPEPDYTQRNFRERSRAEDITSLRERAQDARDIVDNPAFTQAIRDIRKMWFDDLMLAVTTEKKIDLIAQLKALEMLPTMMVKYQNDYAVAAKRQARG